MSRWLPAAALGGILALGAMVVLLALGSLNSASAAQRADALARELRCPDCQGLSVADSPTRAAREIRRQIGELIADGRSDQEVRQHFVARYGEWILLAPSSPLVWLVPFAVLLGGATALGIWLRSGARSTAPSRPALDDEERRRLREEAEALDA